MERAQGFAEQGARVVWTLGYSSRTLVQESAPYATITVYITGTTTLATLYSDNQVPPTLMANPFTANADGHWFFYAIDGRYDVRIDAEDWSWTIGDLLLQDPGRWTADQNANGHWLNNLGGISFVSPNGQCHESIALDNNCNLIWTGPGGNQIMSLSPQGDLTTAGGLNVNGQVHIVATETYPEDCNSGALNITSTNGIAYLKINVTGSNPNTIHQPYTGISFFQNCNYIAEIGAWVHGDPATDGLSIDIGQFTDNIFISYTTGYVGINTGNPPCRLSVVGDVCVTGNGRFSGPLQASSLVLNNGTCSTTIAFDANCYVVVYGSLGVTQNLDVNGLTNLAGDLKVDGSFTLNGPWLENQNANGNSLYGLQKLEVAQIEFHSGPCTAELQFDAACNLVLYGNLKVNGTFEASGGITGAYPGITVQDALVTAGTGSGRVWQAVYRNNFSVPMFVAVSINLGPHDGAIAFTDSSSSPGTEVAAIQSQSEDFTQIHYMGFWVLPGNYYMLDRQILSSNPDWPALINSWVEWH